MTTIKCDVELKNSKTTEVVLYDMCEDEEVINLIQNEIGNDAYIYTEKSDYYLVCICFNEEDKDTIQEKLGALFGEFEIEDAFENAYSLEK